MSLLKFSVIFLFVIVQYSDEYRILGLFPFNGKSHFVMFEQVMKELARKGHTVDVVSHFPLKEEEKNYNDLSLKGSVPNTQNNLNFEFLRTVLNFNSWVKSILIMEMNPLCDLLGHPVMKDLRKPKQPYDLIVTEIFMSPCFLAYGHHLKIPVIGVTTSILYEWMNHPIGNPVNPAFVPNSFKGSSEFMNFPERLINTIKYFYMKHMFSYYSQPQNNYVEKYFGPGFPSIDELQKSVSLILVNSHYSLNGIRPLTSAVVEVGGLHIQDNGEKLPLGIEKWLDESKEGCVYLSFGSMVVTESFPKHVLDAFYNAFTNAAPLRFLIKIKDATKLPPGLPKNVKTFKWVSQLQVLKHKNIKMFVTHGGLMGTLESIFSHVPMIGIPLFGDQFLHVKRYVQKKIAVSLDWATIDGDKFTTAILEILKNPIYKNNIEKLSKLYMDRPKTPQETAVFWIEYIGRNGNVLKSPAVDLEWWQLDLLDIYIVLLFIVITLIYLIYFVSKKLFMYLACLLKCKQKLLSKKKQ